MECSGVFSNNMLLFSNVSCVVDQTAARGNAVSIVQSIRTWSNHTFASVFQKRETWRKQARLEREVINSIDNHSCCR